MPRSRAAALASLLLVSPLVAIPIVHAAAAPRSAASAAAPDAGFSSAQLDVARELRERCLEDDTGYELLRSLTRHVGPRFAGTPGDGRAVAWALDHLRALGFKNVHAEPVTVPHWIRGTCSVEV